MKKLFALLLVLIMAMSVAACERGEEGAGTSTAQSTGSSQSMQASQTVQTTVSTAPSQTQSTAPSQTQVESTPTTEPGPTEHLHGYTEAVTAPTCIEKGYTTHTCACGDSYTDTEVAATGHTYTETVTAPTCTAAGSATYTCACGDSYTKTIEKLAHTYTEAVTPPTCTENGYTTYTCVCGDSCTGAETEAAGHSWQEPACGQQKTCATCGVTEGPVAGHHFADNTCSCGVSILPDTSGVKLGTGYKCYELYGSSIGSNYVCLYSNGTGMQSFGQCSPEYTGNDAELVYEGVTYYPNFGMSADLTWTDEGSYILVALVSYRGETVYYKVVALSNGHILWAQRDASWDEAMEMSGDPNEILIK